MSKKVAAPLVALRSERGEKGHQLLAHSIALQRCSHSHGKKMILCLRSAATAATRRNSRTWGLDAPRRDAESEHARQRIEEATRETDTLIWIPAWYMRTSISARNTSIDSLSNKAASLQKRRDSLLTVAAKTFKKGKLSRVKGKRGWRQSALRIRPKKTKSAPFTPV